MLSKIAQMASTGVMAKVVTVAVCLLWTITSSSAILVNKHIMVDLKFPYPVTVAWLGLLTTTIASATAVRYTIAEEQRVHLTLRQFMMKAMPTGFCMALTFQTGNLSYLYLTVAFIQMLKAFCPVITMVLLFGFGLEKPTSRLVFTVCLISAGVALASWGELNMSLFGLTSMLISVVAESVRLVLTQYILVGTGQALHPLEGLMYIGTACSFWLTVQAFVWELKPILISGALIKMSLHPFHFLLAALAGFGVNILAILVIKLASSLTLKVLATVKDAVLVTVSVVFLHEHVSQLQLTGYSISVCGFVMYNIIKARTAPPARSLLPTQNVIKSA